MWGTHVTAHDGFDPMIIMAMIDEKERVWAGLVPPVSTLMGEKRVFEQPGAD